MNTKKNIFAIGWMCFFWSMSSFIVISLLPFFLTEKLGASASKIGFIEGFCIFAAFSAKFFSGVLSDIFKKRKPIIMIGAIGTFLSKIFFAISSSVSQIFFVRFFDRFVKGIRSTPTDALIADSGENKHGKNYGIRQTLYSMGNVAGGIVASFLIKKFDYQTIFWIASIPSIVSIFILHKVIKDFQISHIKVWKFNYLKDLPKEFWIIVIISFFLTAGRFSTSFLTLYAKECGWQIFEIPIILASFELTFAITAWPFGIMSDFINKNNMLTIGSIILLISYIIMIFFKGKIAVLIGILINGLHLGMTEGLILSIVASITKSCMRGSAFGILYIIISIAVLIGNNLAGVMSDAFSSTIGAMFCGSIFTAFSTALLLFYARKI